MTAAFPHSEANRLRAALAWPLRREIRLYHISQKGRPFYFIICLYAYVFICVLLKLWLYLYTYINI